MRALALAAAASACLVACSSGAYTSFEQIPQDPAPPREQGHFGLGLFASRSSFVGDGASRNVKALLEKVRAKSGTGLIKVQNVRVYPEYITMRVYRGGIDFDDWVWRDDRIEGPTPAHGTTAEDAEKVFDPMTVAWTKVPELRRSALDATALEGGRVSGLYVDLTHGQLQFMVSVQGTRHDATVRFDPSGQRLP